MKLHLLVRGADAVRANLDPGFYPVDIDTHQLDEAERELLATNCQEAQWGRKTRLCFGHHEFRLDPETGLREPVADSWEAASDFDEVSAEWVLNDLRAELRTLEEWTDEASAWMIAKIIIADIIPFPEWMTPPMLDRAVKLIGEVLELEMDDDACTALEQLDALELGLDDLTDTVDFVAKENTEAAERLRDTFRAVVHHLLCHWEKLTDTTDNLSTLLEQFDQACPQLDDYQLDIDSEDPIGDEVAFLERSAVHANGLLAVLKPFAVGQAEAHWNALHTQLEQKFHDWRADLQMRREMVTIQQRLRASALEAVVQRSGDEALIAAWKGGYLAQRSVFELFRQQALEAAAQVLGWTCPPDLEARADCQRVDTLPASRAAAFHRLQSSQDRLAEVLEVPEDGFIGLSLQRHRFAGGVDYACLLEIGLIGFSESVVVPLADPSGPAWGAADQTLH